MTTKKTTVGDDDLLTVSDSDALTMQVATAGETFAATSTLEATDSVTIAAESSMFSLTGVRVTLDETNGLQNADTTPSPATDADDNDIDGNSVPTVFVDRLAALGASSTVINYALSGYNGSNNGANILTISPVQGGVGDLGFAGSDGAPLNGLDSGLDTLSGQDILLYTDPQNNNIALGRAGGAAGEIVFALFLEEVGSPVSGAKIWSAQYVPLKNPDSSDADDPLDLTDKLFVGTTVDLAFSLANAPSGQNLFLMFTTANPTTETVGGVTRVTDPAIIATGKDPANESTGVKINTGDTINTSQAGGPTTFGTNNQMIVEGEGVRFTFVTGANLALTIPNLDQNEADVEQNIDFTDVFNANTAAFDVVQLQSGKSAVVKISAFQTAAEPGVDFIDGYAGDAVASITHVKVSLNGTVLLDTGSSGGPVNGPQVTFSNGIATLSGIKAGYHIEYTTTGDHNRVLIENAGSGSGQNSADFDIGGFKLLQVSTATVEVGSMVLFEDDGPSVSANQTVLLDDDALTGGNPGGTDDDADAANTSGTLGHTFGTDGAGTVSYQTSGAPSGFTYVAGPNNSLLVNQGATTVLTLTLIPETGAYTVIQNAPISHAAGLAENNQAFTISYRATDGDGDTADGTLAINVDDDTPILAFGNLRGTGTTTPQYGEWSGSVGADQPGNLDIALTQFQLVSPTGVTSNGSGFTFDEANPSPDGSGNYLYTGTLTADFDNNAATPDQTVNFSLTAFSDGRYELDLVEGFGSTKTLSSADGSLDAGGPSPVRTLTIGDEGIVFFGVQATTTQSDILTAIVLGEDDLTEAQIEAGGFGFLGTANMNVSTSGIGIANNNFDGNTTAGINTGDESFVINPETLLTSMQVFIDNSVSGYDPATEELYYNIFYDDGSVSGHIKVQSADLTSEAGGQKSFIIDSSGSKLIDAVQLTMGKGTIKIPVIKFITETESLASDVKLDFSATLTDADGDVASSNFSADLFANDLGAIYDFTLLGTSPGLDAFDVDLSSSTGTAYKVEGFDLPNDLLVFIGGSGALTIDNSGPDSIVSVAGFAHVVTVVGVDLTPNEIAFA
jgi:hypothetical protein